jgi:glycosyltransferase involved in cell wall biosynthesis
MSLLQLKLFMLKKSLRISLVIPVYNEESYLADCVRSALAQRQAFYEIIIVDNNSNDLTARIAASFPGVTVLKASRQGVVHARNQGFDAATGDVIARIDADTRLPADWSQHVGRAFQQNAIAAITGKVTYYDTAFARSLSISDNLLRRVVAYLLGRNMALQGANMAIRRSVWRGVRHSVCTKGGLHEDFDLAIHANQHGHRVSYDIALQAEVAFRQAASPWQSFASYYWHCPRTYLAHGIRRGYWLVPVAVGMIVAYPLLHLFSRRHVQAERRLMLRVNPATFVD